MTDKIYTIEEIKDIVGRILPDYDIKRVYLFGSYSRNEATADSDIDFYIEEYKYKKFHHIGTLFADLEEGFKKKIDIVTDKGVIENINSYGIKELINNINREGINIYGE